MGLHTEKFGQTSQWRNGSFRFGIRQETNIFVRGVVRTGSALLVLRSRSLDSLTLSRGQNYPRQDIIHPAQSVYLNRFSTHFGFCCTFGSGVSKMGKPRRET